MAELTIYHNPRCSKSRQTLALLEERGIAPTIVEYLKDTPDAATIKSLLVKLGVDAREMMRRKEEAYAANDLGRDDLSEEDLIAAMIAHPILIERPIVEAGERAIIGRPPENVLELL